MRRWDGETVRWRGADGRDWGAGNRSHPRLRKREGPAGLGPRAASELAAERSTDSGRGPAQPDVSPRPSPAAEPNAIARCGEEASAPGKAQKPAARCGRGRFAPGGHEKIVARCE